MTLLLPFALGGLFGLVTSMVVAYLLLQTVFLVRPSPSDTRQSFFRASRIGSLSLDPADVLRWVCAVRSNDQRPTD